MTRIPGPTSKERGAVLVVALIMLVLITVLVASSFTLSSTDLKSVTNTQFRGEAVTAANVALEQVISSPFWNSPASQTINVDINNDGNPEYSAAVAAPTCVSATPITGASIPPSGLDQPGFNTPAVTDYDTVWDLDATVQDPTTGASAEVHEGVRVLLSQAQTQLVCP